MRHDIKVSVNWQGSRPVPTIVTDRTLSHAIINVFNNAADASAQAVEIDGQWNSHTLTINVRDDGRGLAAGQQHSIGTQILAGESQGLGIGLFLAQTTLKRLGGSIVWSESQPGGVLATIELPLNSLLAAKT